MSALKRYVLSISILVGTTLGAGVFALPYVLGVAGWVTTLIYFLLLSLFIAIIHTAYWHALERLPADTHLLGIVRERLGVHVARASFVTIVLGLVLTLSAYLVLGASFLSSLVTIDPVVAVTLFWIIVSVPLLLNLSRVLKLEAFSTLVMLVIAVGISLSLPIHLAVFPRIVPSALFLPFAPLLFALAGWTAIEPLRTYARRVPAISLKPWLVVFPATLIISVVYFFFALSAGSESSPLTSDGISGLLDQPLFIVTGLLLFGLLAIVTSYWPMSIEVRSTLVSDLRWPRSLAVPLVIFLPYLLVLGGFNNFFALVEIVGGFFIALQYLVIVCVTRSVLNLHGMRRIAFDALGAVFVLVMVYQGYNLLIP